MLLLVLIGDILSPGGSEVGRRGAASPNVLPVRSLPLPASTASNSIDERGGAHDLERAPKASAARS